MTSFSPAARDRLTLSAACLASLMFGLEISSVPVILPILETELGSSFSGLQWIMNAYTLACTTVLMAAGALADRYGRKRIFVISLLLFGITSLACGLARSGTGLIVARSLQGAAGGAMLVCVFTVLSHQFGDSARRAKAFGIWGVVFGIGLGFGPVIGAGVVVVSSWSWVFLVHAPLAVGATVLAVVGIQESRAPSRRKLDLAGIVSLSVGVFAFTWYITQGIPAGLASVSSMTAALIAVASLALFIAVERRVPDPMFDFSIFGNRRFSGALLGSMGMNFSFWPLMVYLPLFFQHGLGYSSIATGLSVLAYTLPSLLLPPCGERLAVRFGPERVIPAGMFVMGGGMLMMAIGAGAANASWLTLLPGCVLAGSGLGVINTPITNTTTSSVPSDRAGMASGMDTSTRFISLAINIAVLGLILVKGTHYALGASLPGGDPSHLRSLAEGLSAGTAHLDAWVAEGLTVPCDVAQQSVLFGHRLAMTYSGVCACVLAATSALAFRGGRPAATSSGSESKVPESI
ncbi:MFS transporter [Stenotrophomonas maltophilia]|uniref:MFS transporter n=1 Tax=Stenotrophomonas maltophilia TaxID=40324 RepID=A0A2W6I6Y8_STEMA|nr:MFS transporter [Stenotrophomonas maltophilia]PZS90844.1 MFS transporter [Stenotrophomonas maltophilia]